MKDFLMTDASLECEVKRDYICDNQICFSYISVKLLIAVIEEIKTIYLIGMFLQFHIVQCS